MTGRAGVVFASRGPGRQRVNCRTFGGQFISACHADGAGEYGKIGKRATQEINYSKTFSDIAKSVEEVDKPDRVGEVVARAIRIAESGTPGPVVVALPTDVLAAASDAATVARRKGAAVRPNDSDTASVADMIKAAERPIMIVGGRIDSAKARQSLLAASEAWGIPVLPTYVHQDVFPNDHANYAVELGIGRPAACERANADDCRGYTKMRSAPL